MMYSMVLLIFLIASIFFIFLDELMMGGSQSRIGPLNLGWYGILTSLINGCNLFISQFMVPKFNVHSGFQLFTMLFFMFSFFNLVMHYPFFLIDMYNSIILTLLLTDMSLFFNVLLAFSGCSKYSMLASIRIISQFISFELMFTTMLLIFIWSFYNLLIASMWFTALSCIINLNFNLFTLAIYLRYLHFIIIILLMYFYLASYLFFAKALILLFYLQSLFIMIPLFYFNIYFIYFSSSIELFNFYNMFSFILNFNFLCCSNLYTIQWSIYLLFLFNLIFNVFFFVSILAESNRVPFDLLEAESELVAGFITEYSSIYFTLILLTEYGSIINMSFWMIILFSMIMWFLMLFLLIMCFLRCTLNRLKFDELMCDAWIIMLLFMFPSLLPLFII